VPFIPPFFAPLPESWQPTAAYFFFPPVLFAKTQPGGESKVELWSFSTARTFKAQFPPLNGRTPNRLAIYQNCGI